MLTWMPSFSCSISTWLAAISERSDASIDCCCASIALYVDCVTQPPRSNVVANAAPIVSWSRVLIRLSSPDQDGCGSWSPLRCGVLPVLPVRRPHLVDDVLDQLRRRHQGR